MPRQRRPIMPVAMTVRLVAESLGIDRNVVYAAVRAGELGPVYQKGVRRVILTGDVIACRKT
jgi:predicted site-specific integrase-resolvase